MYIPTGSRLTYVADVPWSIASSDNFPDFIQRVASDLNNNEGISVEDNSYTHSTFFTDVTFTFHLLTNDTDYSSEVDVKNIVDHYIYTNKGVLPASSRVTSVTVPGGVAQNTGAPAPPTSSSGGSSGSGSGFFHDLGQQLQGASLGLIIGGLAVVGLLIWAGSKA